MRRVITCLTLICALSLAGCGKTYQVGQPENTGMSRTAVGAEQPDIGEEEKERVLDFTVTAEGETLQFPMEISELESMGYEVGGITEKEMNPREVAPDVTCAKEGISFVVQIYNSTYGMVSSIHRRHPRD